MKFKVGDIVKFKDILEDGDEDARFKILEINGDRILVEAQFGWALNPTMRYKTDDLTLA